MEMEGVGALKSDEGVKSEKVVNPNYKATSNFKLYIGLKE